MLNNKQTEIRNHGKENNWSGYEMCISLQEKKKKNMCKEHMQTLKTIWRIDIMTMMSTLTFDLTLVWSYTWVLFWSDVWMSIRFSNYKHLITLLLFLIGWTQVQMHIDFVENLWSTHQTVRCSRWYQYKWASHPAWINKWSMI